jgi:hypothetical protein
VSWAWRGSFLVGGPKSYGLPLGSVSRMMHAVSRPMRELRREQMRKAELSFVLPFSNLRVAREACFDGDRGGLPLSNLRVAREACFDGDTGGRSDGDASAERADAGVLAN